jgi:hypothetical protein
LANIELAGGLTQKEDPDVFLEVKFFSRHVEITCGGTNTNIWYVVVLQKYSGGSMVRCTLDADTTKKESCETVVVAPFDVVVLVKLLFVKEVYVRDMKFSISANVLLLPDWNVLLSFSSVVLSTPYPNITFSENDAQVDGMMGPRIGIHKSNVDPKEVMGVD